MYTVLAIVVFAIVASASQIPEPLSRRELEYLFESWRMEFGFAFDSAEEYIKRMEIFAFNHWEITKHNAMNYSYTLGHNEFSHLTSEEFQQQMLGFGSIPVTEYTLRQNAFSDVDVTSLPKSVDWVEKGAVTPVKNQGQCGSCWSFSTTGALEGAYFIKNGQLDSFSEQNLVDCDKVDMGCNGGLMDNAFDFVKRNGGLCLESDYAYTASRGQCQTSCKKVAMKPSHVDVAQKEESLQAAVAQQPVSIAIQANQFTFQFYRKGVFTGRCGTRLDHGVLVVGYGELNGKEYWKVKNSWGASWGSNGYILLEKGKSQAGGQCGILLAASYPSL